MQTTFEHAALKLAGDKPLVFTAMSKHLFYFRMQISRYVLEQGKVPLNPFMCFDYFLLDTVERDAVRQANNTLLQRADELWIFGPISDGVLSEILMAKEQGKTLRYFSVQNSQDILPCDPENIEFEEEVENQRALI